MKTKRINPQVLEGTIFGKPKSYSRELNRERLVREATKYLEKRR